MLVKILSLLPFQTVAELARKADVSPAALIRFAAAMGFNGFSEMQQLFRNYLLKGGNYRIRAQLTCNRDTGKGSRLLGHFGAASTEAIRQLQALPARSLEDAVERLANARNTFIMGLRRAFPVASYLTYSLWQSRHPVHLIDGVGGMMKAQVESIGPDDLLLSVSYAPHAEETASVITQAREQGAQVILLTDGRLSPGAPEADLVIEVPEAEVGGFRSLTSSMCLAQALVVALAHQLGLEDNSP